MSDLLQRYEEIAREQDVGGVTFTSLSAGLSAIFRRQERSFAPDVAARRDLADVCDGLSFGERRTVLRGFKLALPLCESPIEKLLLPMLLTRRFRGFEFPVRVLLPGEGHLLGDKQVAVVPQLPIKRYRADFGIAGRRGVHLKFLLVECDGAAFHDRVDQVMRDVDRDVAILAHRDVLDIVRFSGAEIYRSAERCADKVSDALLTCWRKDNSALAHKFAVAP